MSRPAIWVAVLLLLAGVVWIFNRPWLDFWIYSVAATDGRSNKHVVIANIANWFLAFAAVLLPAAAWYLTSHMQMTSTTLKRTLSGGLALLTATALLGTFMFRVELTIWNSIPWPVAPDGGYMPKQMPLAPLWVPVGFLKKTSPYVLLALIIFYAVLLVISLQAHAATREPKQAQTAAPPAPASSQRSAQERLTELDNLLSSGTITKDEHQSQRARVLEQL